MYRRRLLATLASATALLATFAAAPLASNAAAASSVPAVNGFVGGHGRQHHRVCAAASGARAACFAEVLTEADGSAVASATTPQGYGPANLKSAYQLPGGGAGSGRTVAIVDAYDDPKAEADLATYRARYGLPTCTTANGCFRKVNQTGGKTLPTADGGWAQEISLDLDMVSAACPACKILLVEAKSASFANLGIGVDTAAKTAGVVAISNSYGAAEFSGESSYAGHYNHPGIAITASSGDNGFGAQVPAAFSTLTAVGGTSLMTASTARGWTETAWSGAGSGCSAYIAKPARQHDAGCSRRTIADVSAVADPRTGVAVYDSYAYQGASGWLVFGGTSASAPIIAAVYALGTPSAAPAAPYSHPGSPFDVVAGSNGSCATAYLCTARVGYDGPTGLGTPKGAAAF